MGGTTFVLYRVLLRTIGEELLGLWALMSSVVMVLGGTNLDLVSGVVKYVAQLVAWGGRW